MEYFLNEPIYQSLASALEDLQRDLTAKQDAPETAGSAGQVLALALVDSELVPVWITPAAGGVTDVQVDGTSIVQDGVANVPFASADVFGVAKTGNFGVDIITSGEYAGKLYVVQASEANIKGEAESYKPITPTRQHNAVFYGLAKAAGDSTQSASSNAVGVYTDDAKHAILNMLGIGFKRKTVTIASMTLNAGDQTLVTIPVLNGYVPVFTRLVFTSSSGAAHMLCVSGIIYQSSENRVRIFNESGSNSATFEGSLQVYYMPLTAFEEVQ